MSGPPASANRLLAPVLFVTSLTVVWLLRWGFTAVETPPEPKPRARPASAGGSAFSRGRNIQGFQPGELPSVASGVVVWPTEATPDAVAKAFAAAWEKLRKEGGGGADSVARQLFADWWKVDPEGAMRFVSEPRGVFGERGGLLLLPLVTRDDPRGAWDLVEKSGNAQNLSWLRRRVVDQWARASPDEVMSFSAGLTGTAKRTAEEAALLGWPLEKALEWCAAVPSTWRRMRAEKTVVKELLQADPARAAAMLRAGSLPVESVAAVFTDSHAYVDPEAFARGVLAAEADPLGFCEWAARSGSAELERAAWTAYVANQRDLSPAEIESIAARAGEKSADAIAAALGHAAPEQALAWAARNGKTLTSLFTSWAEDDPAAALAAADSLPDSRAARLVIAERCLETEPKLALSALMDHPDKAAAAPLLLKASRPAAYQDPALAMDALAAAGTATAVEVSVVMAIGGRVDPGATAEALARYHLPITDYLAVEAFTRGWATADPEATSKWVTNLPPGELRDGGAAGLARQVGAEDPVGGYIWALEIADTEIRNRVLSPHRERLLGDPHALDAMLADPRLSPGQRDGLRAKFPPPQTPAASPP